MWTAKTLIRLGRCPGWSESSLGAQSLCWFCCVAAHFQIATCNCWHHSESLVMRNSYRHDTYGIDVKPSNSASKDAFCTTVLKWRKARVVLGCPGNTLWNHCNPAGTVKPLIHSAGIFIDIFFSPLDIFCQHAASRIRTPVEEVCS